MCYMVTYTEVGDTTPACVPYDTLAQARECAANAALEGRRDVRVWLLTHSVEIQPQAVWKEHAKGLSGA